jgi:histone deacetylase 1/2
LYPDTSSPTPRISSLFTIASIAAREKRAVRTMDIGNAYLNAAMEGEPLYMKVGQDIADYLVQVDSSFGAYKDEKGEIVVKLQKALYGCVQSGKLWYNHIRQTLEDFGFIRNSMDDCVFNKIIDGEQCTVVVYVDDLMVTHPSEEVLDAIEQLLEDTYIKVTSTSGKYHSFIGMNFDFREAGTVKITMEGYIKDMISDYNVSKAATTPANGNIFEDIMPKPLDEENQKLVHSMTARLLYIGTRVRPEILLLVNYLSTRVNRYTEGDMSKVNRCMQYLNKEPELGLTLSTGADLDIHLFADASYGVHADGKSHSASVLKVGNSTILASSTKQKLVTKSTTEAELVCASDMLSLGLWQRDFLEEQGHGLVNLILHQDNTSTIKMLEIGKSRSNRTRHINVRYFFMKERIDNKEIQIVHTGTEDMIADILTKPLQGKLFHRLRAMLLSSPEECKE